MDSNQCTIRYIGSRGQTLDSYRRIMQIGRLSHTFVRKEVANNAARSGVVRFLRNVVVTFYKG